MSQFGWQVMAFRSAQLAGIPTPRRTRDGMLKFLRSCTSMTRPGLASYRPAGRVTRSMTAEALVCRFFLDLPRDEQAIANAAKFLLEERPGEGQANLYYWYYGTLAMFHVGGEPWERWNRAMAKTLLDRQATTGPQTGSWEANTVWGPCGGRVYATAVATLCLEAYYRYTPTTTTANRQPPRTNSIR